MSALGLGSITLSGISNPVAAGPLTAKLPHHAATARRVIFLFMHGGPSHVDTFDFKPRLQRDDGQQLPFSPAENISAVPKLLKSPWKHARHGQSGLWVSELLPNIARHVDDMCVVRSVHSRGQSHGQAVCMMHTGTDNFVRPSVGAWVSYGLGTDNADLPPFVSISPSSGHGGPRNFGCAFLPAIHQATVIGRSGKLGDARIQHLDNAKLTTTEQQRQLRLLRAMNQDHLRELAATIRFAGPCNRWIWRFECKVRLRMS